MNIQEINDFKRQVVAGCHRRGIYINPQWGMAQMAQKIQGATGDRRATGQTALDYLRPYAVQPEPVSPRTPRAPMPLNTHSHPRAAEIDQAQPPMMTPHGIGNGPQNPKIWTR